MSRGMYGEVYWWEVSNPRTGRQSVSIKHYCGRWTIFADSHILFGFDNKEVAELCCKYILSGDSLRLSINKLYDSYDIWVDSREDKCYLRNVKGQISR